MHYLTIKTELSYDAAEKIMLDLLTQDYKDLLHESYYEEGYKEAMQSAIKLVLEYYGGEQALQRLEPQQQEMEL